MMRTKRKFFITVLVVVAVVLAAFVLRVVSYPTLQLTVNDTSKTYSGYSLWTPIVDDLGFSLDKPRDILLIDMEGEVAHTWQVPGAVQLAKIKPNGNLVYATRDRSFKQRAGIREIDPFGNVVWYFRIWVDHDFYLYENGNVLIHFIDDKEAPAIGPGKIRCPGLVEVTPSKEVVWQWRGEEHLSELTELVGIEFPLQKEGQRLFDWAHNNGCQVIGPNETAATDSRFKPGNILVSYCNLNTVAVIDKDSGQIVWAWGPGELDGQHNPQMMDNGHLIIFDNGTERGYSRVIEIDPVLEEIVWEYSDRDANKMKFYAPYISSAQALPNNNVFVCQGEYKRNDPVSLFYRIFYRVQKKNTVSSRLFEVSQRGEVVWDCTITVAGKNMHGVYQATRYSAPYLQPLFTELERAEVDETRRLKSLPYLR